MARHVHERNVAVRALDLNLGNTVAEGLNSVPGFKTSAAFFTFLRANLVLPPSTVNSNISTPILHASSSQALPPLLPSNLATMTSNADDDTTLSSNPLDSVPPLTTTPLTVEADQIAAMKLVADSIAQQRQVASRAVIFHPLSLAVFVGILGIITKLMYKSSSDLGVLITTFAGVTMALLVGVRGVTSGYLNLAEEFSWKFARNEDGDEDTIIGSRYGDEIIGALILRLERAGNGSGKKQAKKGKTGGKGVVRAWSTKLRYRGTGVGTELLEEAVRVTRDTLGNSAEIGFAAEHANSKMVLPAIFNGVFRKREMKAARALEAVIETLRSNSNRDLSQAHDNTELLPPLPHVEPRHTHIWEAFTPHSVPKLLNVQLQYTMRANARIVAPLVRSMLQSPQRRPFSVSSGRQAQWGFIGLGQMGYNMAKNLKSKLPASDTLHVYDINLESIQRFAEETKDSSGAAVKLAGSPREAAEDSETTITVLPEPSHVKNVFGQILQPPLPESHVRNPERLFIDCSTIDPLSSREVANAVHTTQQGKFVDAPMSGGVVGARAGTLSFMLGAPDSLLSRVEPILKMMGKSALHCGPQGAGLSGKLANNYLLAINNIATAEAMNLGIQWGLDPHILGQLINTSTGKCWPSEINNPVKGVVEGAPASRDYAGGFGISLMKKDLKLAIIAAEEAGARLELGSKAAEVYEETEKLENCKGKDFSVVYRYISGAE
ncbi:hypothetical protein B7494_g5207 [Chlorociboria aeruginascens]|nr:hypothetical protein B7494_g5207 [Chlorociboria aeruginascens]